MSAISNLPGNRNSTPEGSNTLRPPQARSLIGAGHALRASADMGAYANAPLSSRLRPSSEVYFNNSNSAKAQGSGDDIDQATQQWLADIDQYEATLEEMATATLDQEFKDELSAIEQWFRVLSEAERTSALYALIQQTTQVQQRFFIQVLTEMAKNHPMSNILSPATFGPKDPMSQKLSDAMSKLTVEGNRNSLGLGRPPPSPGNPGNKRLSGLDPSIINSMFPDAAAAIAKQKEQFTQQTGLAPASARNSMVLPGDRTSLVVPPAISAPDDSKKEVGNTMPPPTSPWITRTQAAEVQPPIQRPKSSSGQAPMGQFSQPPPSAGLRSPRPPTLGGDSNVQNTTLAVPGVNPLDSINHLLSPYAPGASWASMVNTPMVPSFNHQQQATAAADMVANATAMKLAALSTVNNRIQFDDARKYRRARTPDGTNGPLSPGLPPSNFVMTNEHGQILTPQQAAALQSQQLAALTGARSRPNSPGLLVTGASGNISALNFPLNQQNNGFLSAYDTTTAAALAGLNLNQFGANAGMGTIGMMSGHHHDGYISDHSEINRGRSPRGRRGSSKPPEDPTNIELLKDIPAWLRTLRLHKYTDQLKDMNWEELVELDDAGLERKGVNALGARRKMLKVFEQVREARQTGKV